MTSLTPLLARMAAAKEVRDSSAQAKGHSDTRTASPKVDKPSTTWDACVSDLLKMNFLSSPSACAKLVDHIH